MFGVQNAQSLCEAQNLGVGAEKVRKCQGASLILLQIMRTKKVIYTHLHIYIYMYISLSIYIHIYINT